MSGDRAAALVEIITRQRQRVLLYQRAVVAVASVVELHCRPRRARMVGVAALAGRDGRQKGSRRALIDAVAALAVQVISRSCAELTDAVAVPLLYGSSAELAPCRLVPLTPL